MRLTVTLYGFDEDLSEQAISYLRKSSLVFTAILYSCLKIDDQLQKKIFTRQTERVADLWIPLLDHVMLEISEWSLWIYFVGLKIDGFFDFVFSNVSFRRQMLIVDIISAMVDVECSKQAPI